MVDSPPHHFYRMTEENVSEINAVIDRLAEENASYVDHTSVRDILELDEINEDRATEINIERARENLERASNNNDNPFNREYTASFNVDANSIDFGFNVNETSVDLGDTNAPIITSDFDYYGGCKKCWDYSMLFGGSMTTTLGIIHNEEEFEKYKMQFVEHYNKEHRDLYEWRKTKKGEKPVTDQKEMDRKRERAGNHTSTGTFELTGASNITFITDEGREAFGTPVFQRLAGIDLVTSGHMRPEITEEDQVMLNMIEADGNINSEDKKRIEKKYGKSVIRDALGKYRHNLMTRRLTSRRGWRD